MREVLHKEIPEDHRVLCHLYVPSGGDIFEQGVNFQTFAPVKPFVIIEIISKWSNQAKTSLEGKLEKDGQTLESGRS